MRSARGLSQGLTPLLILAAAVALGAWALRVSIVRRAQAEQKLEREAIATTRAEFGDLEIAVEGVGVLEAVRSHPVIAEVSGQIVSIVPNGVRVREGDEIAVLDVPRMERQVRDQQLEYDNALADLERRKRELAAQVRQAEVNVEQARDELARFRMTKEIEIQDMVAQRDHDAEQLRLAEERFARQRKLAEEGLVPLREVELAQAALERDRFHLERLEKDLEIARSRNESEDLDRQAAVTRAESELARTRAAEQDEVQNATMRLQIQRQQLDRLLDQLAKAVVRAPASGIVVLAEEREGMAQRPLRPGDQVWERRPIASIPNLDEMIAVLQVPQEHARLVRRGQAALISVESLPGLVLEGEVTEVAETASEGMTGGGRRGMPTGERAFRSAILIKDTKGAPLRPGMTANVRTIVERMPGVVSVPLECVFEREGDHIVYVRRGDDFRPVTVELGPDNGERVVITSGLQGDEIIALRDLNAAGRRDDEGPGASLAPRPLQGVGL